MNLNFSLHIFPRILYTLFLVLSEVCGPMWVCRSRVAPWGVDPAGSVRATSWLKSKQQRWDFKIDCGRNPTRHYCFSTCGNDTGTEVQAETLLPNFYLSFLWASLIPTVPMSVRIAQTMNVVQYVKCKFPLLNINAPVSE